MLQYTNILLSAVADTGRRGGGGGGGGNLVLPPAKIRN